MRTALFVAVVLGGLAGCRDVTGPAALNGAWQTPPVPSGGSIVLTLHASGSTITGTEKEFGIQGVLERTGNIEGTDSGGVILLNIYPQLTTDVSEPYAVYSARLSESHSLDGTWTETRSTTMPPTVSVVSFYRVPEV